MGTSTDLVPLKEYQLVQKGPAGLDLLKETLDGQEVTEFNLARVRMPSGGGTAWDVPVLGGSEPKQVLEGVVVFFKNSRSFWSEAYSGGNEPPDCSAADAKHATRRTDDVEIPATVDEKGKYICDTCDFAEWGSSDTGSGRGQACKLTRQLFMIVPDRMLPLVVSLPPTSLKRASKYFLDLADYSKDYKRMVTRIKLEKTSGQNVPDFSIAVFEPGEDLEPEVGDLIAEYGEALRPHFEAVRVETAAEVGAES